MSSPIEPLRSYPFAKIGCIWSILKWPMTIILVPTLILHFKEMGFGGVFIWGSLIFWWFMASIYRHTGTVLYVDRLEAWRLLRKNKVVLFRDIETIYFVQNAPYLSNQCCIHVETAKTTATFSFHQKDLPGQVEEVYLFLSLVAMAKMVKRFQAGEEMPRGEQMLWKKSATHDLGKTIEKVIEYSKIPGGQKPNCDTKRTIRDDATVPKSKSFKDAKRASRRLSKTNPYSIFCDLRSKYVSQETIEQLANAVLLAVNHLNDPQPAVQLASFLDHMQLFEELALYQYEKAVALAPDDETYKLHLIHALQRRQEAGRMLE